MEKIDPAATQEPAPALKNALQKAIFNNPHFCCIATDTRGLIRIFNVGAERMLGYDAADMVNQKSPDAISVEQELIERTAALSTEFGFPVAFGFETLVFKASRGIEDIIELTYVRKDGNSFPAYVSVTALRDHEDVMIGYLFIGTDNTKRKQAELALQDHNAELEIARAIADKANMAKSEFLSNMSHELRTPLNAVLGFAQLMESATPLPSPAQKLSIEQILKGGWYLLRLINEILDLAMIESGKLTIEQEAMSLTDVLQDCEVMIAPQAKLREIQMNFPGFESHLYVNADRTRVKQVLINLLSNAIKYNREGGRISVECKPNAANRVRISVSDTGAGLTPQQIDQLYQPFNRLGQEASTAEGTGIGLVVTKQLVEMMGGTVGVESIVGVGSVFWIELEVSTSPVVQFDIIDEIDIAPQVHRTAHTTSSQFTLLYVEDNSANLDLVTQLVSRRSDLKLLSAIDGHLGVQMARAYLPDVILMDINLPGISGHDALQILRTDPATVHIPVLALSANANPRDIDNALKAGFFQYLTKPIRINEFMESLDVALNAAAVGSLKSEITEK
jgi:signal transduction histidine kinase/ActR/RegA family two-component response regulator